MQVRETSSFDELWDVTPISSCGASVIKAYENNECYVEQCNGTAGVFPPLDDLPLFDFPESNAAGNLLLWMVFFRISLFEFNEMEHSKRHALRRHYWTGLLWRFFQPFITACILIVGYVMELVIAGHAPEGLAVPALLAFALGMFITLVELLKVGCLDGIPHTCMWVHVVRC